MRILFLCSSLERGGLEHEVEANARLALKAAHDVRVFTPYKVRDDSTIRRNLQPIIPFDSGQEQWRRTPYGRVVMEVAKAKHLLTNRRRPSPSEEVRLARRFVPAPTESGFWDAQARRILEGCDLLHLFGKPKPFLARAARHARSSGLKIIYEEASQVTVEYANRHDHQLFAASSALCDVIIARCDRHVESIREQYQYRGVTRVIEQWAYGTEDDLLELERVGPDSTREAFVFGSICRLDGGKGVDTILKAFARVRQEAPNVRLRIAGQGQSEGDLRNLAAELKLDGDAEFVGYADGEKKISFYASLDAFVIASLNEGGPITGVEAMAAGLPILSTPVGAMPERLEDGTEALFFDAESVEGLAAGMTRLLRDSALRRQLGAAARRRYHTRNHSAVCTSQKTALWDEMGRRAR